MFQSMSIIIPGVMSTARVNWGKLGTSFKSFLILTYKENGQIMK